MSKEKAKIIVFDLDYTLWPFWIDTHVTPPFTKRKQDEIVDAHGQVVRYYKDVPGILEKLLAEGYELGVASRTSEVPGAYKLLNVLGWDKYFKYKEIYPDCKISHFTKIQQASKVDYKDMIFFDDEQRNITDVSKLGVLSILVPNGMSFTTLDNALKKFASRKS